MERLTAHLARLGAELGPAPPGDLLPTPATVVAWVAVERSGDALDADPDPDVAAAVGALHRLLGRTTRPWCGPGLDRALAGLDPTWAPAHAVRLAAAVATGLAAGHLPAGMPWAVHVEDPAGAAGPALGPVLDLLAGLLDGWDPTLAPPTVTTNLGSFTRAGAGYRSTPDRLSSVPDLWIDLAPSTPAENPQPEGGDAPLVVMRRAPEGAADPGIPPPTGMPPSPAPALAAVARWCLPSGSEGDAAAVFRDEAFPAGAGGSDRPAGAGEAGQEEPVGAGDEGHARPVGAGGAGPGWPRDAGPPDAREDAAGLPGQPEAWGREVADLVLAARPDEAAAWCGRALVEARHPAGSRVRHARLVQAAAATSHPADELRRHARALRSARRGSWALDVWAVADADLTARLVADVVEAPADCARGELALALAARVEEAARQARVLASGQTAG